jgi:heme o synthase
VTAHNATEGAAARPARIADFVALAKPRLNALTVFAVGAGAWGSGMRDGVTLALTLAGAAMVAASAAAVNQWMERDLDARMVRTADRPLPAGRIHPRDALVFAALVGAAGVAILATSANVLTAVLGVVCLGTYVALYTPLKTRTSLNTLAGTIPGALPPVMGVAAARGELTADAAFLFALMVAWQIPHFLAIAWLHREDYRRAGFAMLPVVPGGEASTARQAVVYAILVLVIGMAATPLRLAGNVSFYVALACGLGFVAAAIAFAIRRTDGAARTLLRTSLVHLPLVLAAFALDRTGS